MTQLNDRMCGPWTIEVLEGVSSCNSLQTTPHHIAEQQRPKPRDNFLSAETQAALLLKA